MEEFGNWRHICVDVQRMFAEDTPWYVPWMARVLPQLVEACERHAERTIFTRFIPPLRSNEASGSWKVYYKKWWMMTGERSVDSLLRGCRAGPCLPAQGLPAGFVDGRAETSRLVQRAFRKASACFFKLRSG